MEVVISGLAKAKMGVQHNEIDYDKWTNVMEDPFVLEMRARHERLIYEWNTYLLWLRENDTAMWETYKIAMEFWGEIRELAGPDCDLEQILKDGDAEEECDCAAIPQSAWRLTAPFAQGSRWCEPNLNKHERWPPVRGPPGERVRMQR